jgi:hypothetical protein
MSKSTKRPLSLRGYAKHRGVTLGAVQRAIESGRLVKSLTKVNGATKIADPAAADGEWAANTDPARTARPAAGGPQGAPGAPDPAALAAALAPRPDDPVDVTEARVRLLTAQAELAEHELALKRGEVVPAAEVEGAWAGIVTASRARLLGVPSRMKELIPHLTTDEMVTLDDLIREALEELAGPKDGDAAGAAVGG